MFTDAYYCLLMLNRRQTVKVFNLPIQSVNFNTDMTLSFTTARAKAAIAALDLWIGYIGALYLS